MVLSESSSFAAAAAAAAVIFFDAADASAVNFDVAACQRWTACGQRLAGRRVILNTEVLKEVLSKWARGL